MHVKSFSIKCNALVIAATILMFSPRSSADRLLRRRVRSCPKAEIPNAELSYKSNFKIMRVNCAPGYALYGGNYVVCEMGKWNAALPVCAKAGCKDLESPRNGDIMSKKLQQAHLYCKAGYRLAGGGVTYCNGTHWDRPLGTCRESSDKVQLSCDFETEDLCGWSHDETHDFDWKRIMAANTFSKLRTGPQHDHTTLSANSGHYMLMESFDQVSTSVARLMSPIYSKNVTANSACFKFFYFMYGATVGNLSVYIRPISVNFDALIQLKNNQIKTTYRYFLKSGNQKNVWNEGHFKIDEMSEDFQIIIEGTTGTNHLSDIAIDDVQLMTYAECYAEQMSSSTSDPEMIEPAIFDVQSCEGRCGETNITNYGIAQKNGQFYKNCDCHGECEELNTCCPNYQSVCEVGVSASLTDVSDTRTTTKISTFSTVAVTAPTSTTPTTTPTTTTTTTPTPTTTSTTPPTTTTTTKAPTKPTTLPPTTTVAVTRPTTPATTTSTKASTAKLWNITKTSSPLTTTSTTTTTASPLTVVSGTPESNKSIATTKSPGLITVPSGTENPKSDPDDVVETDEVEVSSEGSLLSAKQPSVQREKIISWEVADVKQSSSKSPLWLILTATAIGVSIIAAMGVVLRYHRTFKRLRIYNRDNADTDTTSLLYSQGDELVVVS